MDIHSILKTHGLIIATHNKGKLKEIQELLKPIGIRCTSAGERGLPEPEETGETFEANAELKARAAALASKMPALADDSGLAIPALGGAPGVYSARWAGKEKDFSKAFERIQTELVTSKAPQNPPAYFMCALSLAIPSENMAVKNFTGRVDGHLTFPPRGVQGFGYDPIFIKEGMEKTFAEITAEEKHAISHRANAFKKFVEGI